METTHMQIHLHISEAQSCLFWLSLVFYRPLLLGHFLSMSSLRSLKAKKHLEVVLQTNISGIIQDNQVTHTVWTGKVPVHTYTVNSLAGGDEVYFYHSRQTEETHRLRHQRATANQEREGQTEQPIRSSDGQVDVDANRQAGRKTANLRAASFSLHISTFSFCLIKDECFLKYQYFM